MKRLSTSVKLSSSEVTLPGWLTTLIEGFLRTLAKRYSDPEFADGRCGVAFDEFVEFAEKRIADVSVIEEVHFVPVKDWCRWHAFKPFGDTDLFSYEHPHHKWYIHGCRHLGHIVARVEGIYIDFTARQFDPQAPFPLIFRMEAS